MTLILDMDGCCNRMFSGFKSQCITFNFFKNCSVCSSWLAKLLITIRLIPCSSDTHINRWENECKKDFREFSKLDTQPADEVELINRAEEYYITRRYAHSSLLRHIMPVIGTGNEERKQVPFELLGLHLWKIRCGSWDAEGATQPPHEAGQCFSMSWGERWK